MRTTTIRWPDGSHELVANAAARERTTLSQYVREAAIMRAAMDAADTFDLADQQLRQAGYATIREWLDEMTARQPPSD